MDLLVCTVFLWLSALVVTEPPHFPESHESVGQLYYSNQHPDVKLACQAKSEPPPKFTWYLGNKRVIPTPDSKIDQITGDLLLTPRDGSLSGVYHCTASNMFGTAVGHNYTVGEAKIKRWRGKKAKSYLVNEGEPLAMKCSSPGGYPSTNVYWARIGSESQINSIKYDNRVYIGYDHTLYFANVRYSDMLADDEHYACVVNNQVIGANMIGAKNFLTVRKVATIRQRKAKLVMSSEKMQTVVKGSKLKLACIFTGYPTPEITWKYGDEVKGKGPLLELPFFVERTNNKFICEATQNDNLRASKEFIIAVNTLPFWIIRPTNMNKAEEDNVEFSCKAGATPRPKVTWTVNGKPINESASYYDKLTNSISLRNLTKSDSMVLQCYVVNKYGSIFTNAYLNVLAESPTFTSAMKKKQVAVTKIQPAKILCQVFAAPSATYTWTLDNKPVNLAKSPNGKYTRVKASQVLEDGTLVINDVVMQDSGTYKCKATNKLGSIDGNTRLVVKEPTRIIGDIHNQTATIGKTILFRCVAVTDKSQSRNLKVTWKLMSEVLVNKDKYEQYRIKNEFVMKIKKVDLDDTGEYTCTASNNNEVSKSTHLIVQAVPDTPLNVKIENCSAKNYHALISWDRPSNNNAPILEYLIYGKTEFSNKFILLANNNTGNSLKLKRYITLSPWTNNKFRIRARNKIGLSEMSSITKEKCMAPPSIPYKQPSQVCENSDSNNQLKITWKKIEKIDQNAPGFHYVTNLTRISDTGDAHTSILKNVTANQISHVINSKEDLFFKRFVFTIQAANNKGVAPNAVVKRLYSYQMEPLESVENFRVVENTIKSNEALFKWKQIDISVEKIRGYFTGFELRFWPLSNPKDITKHFIQFNGFNRCSNQWQDVNVAKMINKDQALVNILPSFTPLGAMISLRNAYQFGPASNVIKFTTKDKEPNIAENIRITYNDHSVEVTFDHPINDMCQKIEYFSVTTKYVSFDMISSYGHVISTKNVSLSSMRTHIDGLRPETSYKLFVTSHCVSTSKTTTQNFRMQKTLAPDIPTISVYLMYENVVNVSWNKAPMKPYRVADKFAVDHMISNSTEGWLRLNAQKGQSHLEFKNLEHGSEYRFRIVAIDSKSGRESYSIVKSLAVRGREATTIPTTTTTTTTTTTVPTTTISPAPPSTAAKIEKTDIATTSQRIGARVGKSNQNTLLIIFIVVFLIIAVILVIAILLYRNRGGDYEVHEKEKLRSYDNNDDIGFNEYVRPPDMSKSKISLESEDGPIDSETGSLAEYADVDPMKFNEDGSFIGIYGDKRTRSTRSLVSQRSQKSERLPPPPPPTRAQENQPLIDFGSPRSQRDSNNPLQGDINASTASTSSPPVNSSTPV